MGLAKLYFGATPPSVMVLFVDVKKWCLMSWQLWHSSFGWQIESDANPNDNMNMVQAGTSKILSPEELVEN